MAEFPIYDEDVFADDAILDPWPHYARMRDLGPVVRLGASEVLAVTRYAGVRQVLGDHVTFRSGDGVMFSDLANQQTRGTLLASDPPLHDALRRTLAHRLTPRALGVVRETIAAKGADVVTQALAGRGVVDGMRDLAEAMPMSFVPEFLGFPHECHPRLLEWAGAAIDVGGPASGRTPGAVVVAQELSQYAELLVRERALIPGSLGDDILAAADRGEIDAAQAVALLIDYFGPSLETTISALASALWLFSENPDQWQLLRSDPSLVGAAFNEVVRLESPLRAFTRLTSADTTIEGVRVPAGSRVAVFYASANRDERRWDQPDRFDLRRDSAFQLGLGHGVHACVGQGLARQEFAAVLTPLAAEVQRIEPAGPPVRRINSLLRTFDKLPLLLHRDSAA